MQELWLSCHEESRMCDYIPDYNFQIATPDLFNHPEDKIGQPDHNWHGAGIAWHHSLKSYVVPVNNVNERFTGIRIKMESKTLFVISVYFPTRGKDDQFLECISCLSNFITSNTVAGDVIIVGCDSNCSENSTKRRISALNWLCEEHFLAKLVSTGPTFHHNNGTSEANLDYYLVSKQHFSLFAEPTILCTLNHPLNLSAHDVISSSLNVARDSFSGANENVFTHTFTPYEVKHIVWDGGDTTPYRDATDIALKHMEEVFNEPEFIPLKCELYSRLLVTCAEGTLKVKTSRTRKSRSLKFSKRQNKAWKEFDKSFKAWSKAGKPRSETNHLYKHFKLARSNFQRIRRYEDNLKSIKHNNQLMTYEKEDKTQLYRLVKAAQGKKAAGPLTTKLITPSRTYQGSDILEGFVDDAERLGKIEENSDNYDNKFYNLCKMDNVYIFDFNGEDPVKIPDMTLVDLDRILHKEMKSGKAADVYKLKVEHIRFAGDGAKKCILNLLNQIIRNIYFLTCTQIKKGLGSSVYKGKGKPLTKPDSYRRITVTPQLGNILDRFIDPVAEEIFSKVQSPEQLGFTKNISYLLGAVVRGECQRWAIDRKTTCFGVTFDGKAAFPSVDREIQVRELFSIGESGDYLEYSKNTYTNTTAHMKQDKLLSREFREEKGARQGHKRASGNFKTYINPCLTSTNQSNLGFNIGPICVTSVCIADDTYVMSDDARKLQGAINIVAHYGRRYRLIFGAEKTKVTVTGSVHDMEYYQQIPLWTLYGEYLTVSENNEHLGLVVSGLEEEQKNIDKNVKAARKAIFALLSSSFAFKCNISPSVKIHLWRTFVRPVLTSGLSALPVRPSVMKTLSSFHLKILRGFLKLSKVSPIVPLYFLLGELPIEAVLHLGVFSLFWNLWSNPQTKLHHIVKYILKMSGDSSVTWSVHLRILMKMYDLPNPLGLLEGPAWCKEKWKELYTCKVRAYHEKKLRIRAASNYKLRFLNIQATGLNGHLHPALLHLTTPQDIKMARPHLKMLSGDYICNDSIAKDRGGDPRCRLCPSSPGIAETICHILTECKGTIEPRTRIWPELLNVTTQLFPENKLLLGTHNSSITAQFVLDSTSLNLPNEYRLDISHPGIADIFRVARQYCYAVSTERLRNLKVLS